MKDGKKANTHAKKTNPTKEKPKVREVKVEEKFFDDDDSSDKRLVVFAIIAILVILATIVTLVIGCEKKKEEEPVKPVDDIVVPEKKDEKEEEEEYEGVETKEIVRKVTAVYTGSKKEEEEPKEEEPVEEKEEVKNVHTVTFDYGDEDIIRTYDVEVEDGQVVEPYVPEGTYSCSYYVNNEFEEEYDFNTPITADTTIYTWCNLVIYNLYYEPEDDSSYGNPEAWTIYDDDQVLNPVEDETFVGWYAEDTFENEITEINLAMLQQYSECDEEGAYCGMTFYAKFEEKTTCEGNDCEVDPIPCEGEACNADNPDGGNGDGSTTGEGAPETKPDEADGQGTLPETGKEGAETPDEGEPATPKEEGKCEGTECPVDDSDKKDDDLDALEGNDTPAVPETPNTEEKPNAGENIIDKQTTDETQVNNQETKENDPENENKADTEVEDNTDTED